MWEKKKLKNLRKFRDGHRSFVRKTIASATELLSGGNPIDVKKLKLFRAALQTKYSELQALDQEIAELLDDVSKTEQDVVESCELSSAIHACILELETALAAEEAQGKVRIWALEALEYPKVSRRKLSCMRSYRSSS